MGPAEWGTLFTTDRHLVLATPRSRGVAQQLRGLWEGSARVRLVPLASVEAVVEEEGLVVLRGARVLTADLAARCVTEVSDAGFAFRPLAPGRYMFGVGADAGGEERALGPSGSRPRGSRRRQLLLETVQELVAAHHLAAVATAELHRSPSHARPTSASDLAERLRANAGALSTPSLKGRDSAAAEVGVGAMAATLRRAWRMGPLELLRRGGRPVLAPAEEWRAAVEARALPLWAALNLKRRFALMRVTGRPASGLLSCSLITRRGAAQPATEDEAEARRAVANLLWDSWQRHRDRRRCGLEQESAALSRRREAQDGCQGDGSLFLPVVSRPKRPSREGGGEPQRAARRKRGAAGAAAVEDTMREWPRTTPEDGDDVAQLAVTGGAAGGGGGGSPDKDEDDYGGDDKNDGEEGHHDHEWEDQQMEEETGSLSGLRIAVAWLSHRQAREKGDAEDEAVGCRSSPSLSLHPCALVSCFSPFRYSTGSHVPLNISSCVWVSASRSSLGVHPYKSLSAPPPTPTLH